MKCLLRPLAVAILLVALAGCGAEKESKEPKPPRGAPDAERRPQRVPSEPAPEDELSRELEDTTPEEERQADWENQEGEDWEAFNSGYESGWDSGCEIAFEGSLDSTLYDEDGEPVELSECKNGFPGDASSADVPIDVPDEPESAGEELGETDGCNHVFDELAFSGTLYYEGEEYDASVCP